LIFRQPLRRRLNKLTDLCADSEKDKLIVTLEALIITGFLAAPLPIAFYLTGSLINMIGKSAYWYASADAFFKIAVITAILESIRQVFADRGIAEVHFDWHISSNRQFNRRLLKTEAMALPLLYIALFFAFAGMRLDSPAELQMYNNSLGRLVFIVALLILGLSILTLLRPEKKTDPPELYTRVTWPRQLSGYAFPTVFLGVYPVITLTTLIPSIMAAFGYYLTGLLLAYQMQRSLLLAFIVLIGWGLIQRAQVIRQQQRPLEQDTGSDHETADKQIRHLSRFIIMTIFVIGLLYIWSDALPMIQIFKRIQLLPNIELLEPVDNLTTSPGLSTGENGTSSTPSNDSNGSVTQAAETSDVTGSVDNTIVTSHSPDQPALTLWTVLQAILLMILSLVLVRNLPGVIEVIL
ncbi:MAG: hypothetical protein KAJ98_03340, partial [Spirochaetaceae bacterium]|nr:hypothetical protein [Spirochaetaceae bacterium]